MEKELEEERLRREQERKLANNYLCRQLSRTPIVHLYRANREAREQAEREEEERERAQERARIAAIEREKREKEEYIRRREEMKRKQAENDRLRRGLPNNIFT